MATKKIILPFDVNVENIITDGTIVSSTAKLTKKNDVVHIKSNDGMYVGTNKYKTVNVSGVKKGNDIILFDNVNDINNLNFKQITGTKDLQITVKENDKTVQEIIVKNFYKKAPPVRLKVGLFLLDEG